MNTGCPDTLWSRVHEGKPVFWVGAGVVRWMPPAYQVFRLNCAVSWVSGGRLHTAYRRMRVWSGEESKISHAGGEEQRLRVSLLEEMSLQVLEPMLVKTSQQLAQEHPGNLLIWFDAVERADQSVIPTLRRFLVLAQDALALPWVFCFHEEPQGEYPQGEMAPTNAQEAMMRFQTSWKLSGEGLDQLTGLKLVSQKDPRAVERTTKRRDFLREFQVVWSTVVRAAKNAKGCLGGSWSD